MPAPAPHFLLLAECNRQQSGDWRFVLQTADGRRQLEVADAEPQLTGERLELLTVVRGLESLDQPSRVTLVTPSKYVTRGLAYGLEEWRSNGFQWERHGEMVPVKNRDLWQRIDHALQFHTVDCRVWRIDRAHHGIEPHVEQNLTAADSVQNSSPVGGTDLPRDRAATMARAAYPRRTWKRLALKLRRSVRDSLSSWRLRAASLGTVLLPRPWLE